NPDALPGPELRQLRRGCDATATLTATTVRAVRLTVGKPDYGHLQRNDPVLRRTAGVDHPAPRREVMARGKIARMVIAQARARRITPAAAKRIAAFKPFGRPRPPMRLAMGSMPRAPRAPRPFGMPKPIRRRRPRERSHGKRKDSANGHRT